MKRKVKNTDTRTESQFFLITNSLGTKESRGIAHYYREEEISP